MPIDCSYINDNILGLTSYDLLAALAPYLEKKRQKLIDEKSLVKMSETPMLLVSIEPDTEQADWYIVRFMRHSELGISSPAHTAPAESPSSSDAPNSQPSTPPPAAPA